MAAYYNELDPYAAQWLRNLIAAGHIAAGDVDERSIVDVRSADLRGYRQCHFFAGIGVWSYALRIAGWPDYRGVWTGSCPCQPFSAAGIGAGFEDERHLWPAWFTLIRERRPGVIFGEQVASKDGLAWLDIVQPDMEDEGYAFAPVDLCAAGFGAPHIRQRLFFVADACSERRQQERRSAPRNEGAHGRRQDGDHVAAGCVAARALDNPADARRTRARQHDGRSPPLAARPVESGSDGSVADAEHDGGRADITIRQAQGRAPDGRPGPVNGFWAGAEWLPCVDGRTRPVEPGTFPLAHGITNRVGRLRAYGNAINAEVARHFIEAYISERP